MLWVPLCFFNFFSRTAGIFVSSCIKLILAHYSCKIKGKESSVGVKPWADSDGLRVL